MIPLTTKDYLIMNALSSYSDTVYELNVLQKRLNLVLNHESEIDLEKKRLIKLIDNEKKVIKQMENDLQQLSGVENKLYYEIVIKGNNVTKAIDKVASNEFIDTSTLWKNYYPKIKTQIDNLYLLLSEKK
ncbi:MAG: hypothetical protein ACI4U0_01575 [Candidatus Aphodocola sp.]